MRAVVLSEFGPPAGLVAVGVPDPVAGAGQALVEVQLAGVTFVETQVRAGRPPHPAMAPVLPVVPGNGVGGRVAAVGEGVDEGLVGRRVVTTTGGSGGYAERVAVSAQSLIEVPDELAMADAVALLADGRTALSLLEAVAPQPGETVLVLAAGGGVGSLLVQLARAAGARVVAAASGPRKGELARELGAEVAVDYAEACWTARAGLIDVVFDGVGGALAAAAFDLVTLGGRFCSFGMASGAFAPISAEVADDFGVTLVRSGPLTPERSRTLSERALALAAAGRLRPVVGQTFALDRAGDAHAAIESRATVGKTLLVT
ncbi:MAG: NADPH:quinone reductase [Solirubrobacteraceae bacterium]|jgi:NADPH2:quinone reductase|nr:NADPH:quinone reductase [Solirubrobacteraceae bacterium]